jgi:hypothetical protein
LACGSLVVEVGPSNPSQEFGELIGMTNDRRDDKRAVTDTELHGRILP